MNVQSRQNIWLMYATQLLIVGLLIGYLGFVFWLGVRWIVIFSGALIVALAIASWKWRLQDQEAIALDDTVNLLQANVFLNHINYREHKIPDASKVLWQSVKQQAVTIHQIAVEISQEESTLTPDLLETLHSILDLIDRLVQGLQVNTKVQTPYYQELTKQQLQSCLARLQDTQDQLQELHDQIALDNLGNPMLNHTSVISSRLQTLINENTRGIIES
ncbi:DUF2244 domain-containing protein [Nostoc sp. CMAA1605]|uniref:DUF2244 domain-containing protein n=1 Tax=Nostoc sp. CMAA1605 TaxID=2055159 RepID=UPI001F1A7DE1|nr:DUF2244 domain-containing protein [Nostoc sp. CMAA1605]